MARSLLDDERGVGEQSGVFGHRPRGAVQVELPGEEQDGGCAGGERRACGLRVEGALGAEEGDGFRVARPAGRVVLPRRGVPPAVQEGADGLPVAPRSLGDRLQRGVCGREPGLVPPQHRELPARLPRDGDADGPGAGGDQGEPAEVLRVPGRVLRRGVRSGGVGEQVDPGEAEMVAQGLDVVDETVTAVGGGVLGDRRAAGAPEVEYGQAAVRGQAAEVAEVGGVRGASRDADDRVAASVHAVGEPGSVGCGEGGHDADPLSHNLVIQPSCTTRL